MEFIIDCTEIPSPEALHRVLADLLSFPEWYGHNLDALYDSLCSISGPTSLVFSDWDCIEAFAEGFHRVLTDAELENPHLTVSFE